MFKVTKRSDTRVDIEIKGRIEAEDMKAGLEALIQAVEGVEDGVMLYTITEFEFPALGAFGVEMGQLPKLFSIIGKFDKCAVLSDAGWIKTAAQVEGALIPGLDIKSFDPAEADQAEAWLIS